MSFVRPMMMSYIFYFLVLGYSALTARKHDNKIFQRTEMPPNMNMTEKFVFQIQVLLPKRLSSEPRKPRLPDVTVLVPKFKLPVSLFCSCLWIFSSLELFNITFSCYEDTNLHQ